MSNKIELTLSAKNETDAAFAAARRNMTGLGGATPRTAQELSKLRTSMSQAGAASQALQALLGGNVSALDNMGVALAGSSSKLAAFGLKLGAVGIVVGTVVAVWRKLAEELNIVDKLKAWVKGEDVSAIRTVGDAAEKKIKDLQSATKRASEMKGARSETIKSEIAAMDIGPEAKAVLLARETARREREQAGEMNGEAQQRLYEARLRLAVAEKESGLVTGKSDQKKINTARDELARAEADAATAAEIKMMKRAQASEKLAEAMRKAGEQIEKLTIDKLEAQINIKLQVANSEIQNAQEYIDRVVAGRAATRDRRLRDVGGDPAKGIDPLRVRAMQGDKAAADELAKKAIEVGALDQLVASERERTRPGRRSEERAVERERRIIENRLERAQAAQDRGGPLAKWQKELLDQNAGAKFEAAEQRRKLDAQEARDDAHRQALENNGANAVDRLDTIMKNLNTLLQAAGG